jgi:outer membrane protein assembly factor BamB
MEPHHAATVSSPRFSSWPRRIARAIPGALLFAALSALSAAAGETNWPEFRGLRQNGVSVATNLPLHWSEAENIKWQTPIHGKAWSSPVIWGNQLWLTTATEDGRELGVLCVDADTGKIVRDEKLFDVEKPQAAHAFNSYASPTPVIEQGRIYISYGSPASACLDTGTGKVLWSRRDIECNHYRGAGSSPILYSNLVILNFDGSDRQFVIALDKATGKTVWQTKRSIDFKDLGPDNKPEMNGDFRKAFATCQIAPVNGRDVLLSQGSKALYAYEPLTGEELWRLEERSNYSGCTRPVLGGGLIFVPSGFSSGQILAVRPGKKGDVVDANDPAATNAQLRVAWKTKRNAPKKPSLLLVDDLLYAIDDNGTATCWEAATGTNVWTEHVGGHYSAAPLASPGRIYLFSETGKTTVFATGREFKMLAENQLGDGFMASPAVTGNALFLRSRTRLYRVE